MWPGDLTWFNPDMNIATYVNYVVSVMTLLCLCCFGLIVAMSPSLQVLPYIVMAHQVIDVHFFYLLFYINTMRGI